ncbi:hypothetical protein AWB77_04770 [Caballeronia fortuita]|uniref:Uncharacterized protein n=1 Tax=Caballeronia fortuita TaxID=1777138 RepID=A0A158D1C3_9BURK|nr:hypothetical protein [Caballeronia fortuita]SAK88303.1 hypothetical protein AWB77_04770 [Caballeronia fortuita]
MTVFVQFADSTEKRIVSVFGCEQDPSVWPNQGQVGDDDPRLEAFQNGLPDQFDVSSLLGGGGANEVLIGGYNPVSKRD